MNENVKKFVEKAIGDKELMEKMSACKSPEEAYAVASSVQEGFTMEEFVSAMQEIYDATHEAELTDEDMAKVAGGQGDEQNVSMVLSAMSGASASMIVTVYAVDALAGAAL